MENPTAPALTPPPKSAFCVHVPCARLLFKPAANKIAKLKMILFFMMSGFKVMKRVCGWPDLTTFEKLSNLGCAPESIASTNAQSVSDLPFQNHSPFSRCKLLLKTDWC